MARLEESMQERCIKSAISINYFKNEYKYNSKTKELDLIKENGINVYEEIQSNKECALNIVLDKFLNQGILPQFKSFGRDNVMSSKIDLALEKFTFFEKLKEKYNLPEDYSEEQVMNFLEKAQVASGQKIKDLEKINEIKKYEKDEKDEKLEKDDNVKKDIDEVKK